MAHIPAKIKSTYYFPRPSPFPQLQYVGYILLVLAIVQGWNGAYVQAGFFIFLGLGILLLKSWSKLDVDKLTIVDFFAIIPYRTTKLPGIHKVVFTEGQVSQTMGLRANTTTISYIEYKILLDTGGERIKLQAGRNQKKLLKKAQSLAQASKTELLDQPS